MRHVRAPRALRTMAPGAALLLLLTAAPGASLPAITPAEQPGSTASPRNAPRRLSSTEQVQVNLVLIDVVVRDNKGNPVPGLTRDAFELLVDRLPVEPDAIESFEEVCPSGEPAPDASLPATTAASAPEGPVTPAAPEPVMARHIVVVFDFAHLSLSGRRQSLQAARRFLSTQLGPADQVMLLAYKRGMRLVQDFTNSSSKLVSRIDEMLPDTASLEGEVLEEGSKVTEVARRPCDAEDLAIAGANAGATCFSRRSLANVYAVEEEARTRKALQALEDLMPALSSLRGRKAVVVFSDVLRDEPGIEFTTLAGATPLSLGIDIRQDLLRLTREANAAGVALYTVHASGLDDASRTMFAQSPGEARDVPAVREGLANAARSGLDSALSLQTTLAAETGGRAIQRTNDLGSVLAVARQDLSCHYMLGYRHPGAGDSRRHSLIVRLRPAPDGRARRYDVRHRPYYIDYAPSERRDRLMRSALDVPDLHPAVPLAVEAFALAPAGKGRRVLLKATVPLASLALLPGPGGERAGHIRVRCEVTPLDASGGATGCKRDAELPLAVPRTRDGAPPAERLIYETECDLPAGAHDLSVAVLDLTTQETGGRRVPLVVPAQPPGREPLVSEVHLWVRDPAAILVTSDAEGLGLKDRAAGGEPGAFVPLARRLLSAGQPAMLSVLLCPAAGSLVDADHPVRARRVLRGDGGAIVADFRDLTLTQAPDAATGCWQLLHQIPAGTLGAGVYTFSLQAAGEAIGPPLTREADLAVE